MDLFSHALLPYLLGNSLRRNKQEITAFVLGGIAPDFDISLLWIQYLYPTFLLITHRGITHTLFFGFFTALAVLYLASRNRVKTFVHRFIDFEPVISRRTIMFAYAGVILHLFLDYTTTRGISLFYPFDITRYSAEVFFYTDTYLTVLSLIIIAMLYKMPFQRINNKNFLAVFLVVFAVLGAIRVAEKTNAEDFFQSKNIGTNIETFPTMNPFNWYALGENADKFTIYEYNGISKSSEYNQSILRLNVISRGKALGNALDLAKELPQIKMFEWAAYAVAINASSYDGAWYLEYYDPVQRAMARDIPVIFRRPTTNFSSIRVMVESGKAVVS